MASSRISDFAKRPTKEKVMIFALIGGLIGLLYWQFFYKPAKKARAAAQESFESEEGRKTKLARDRKDRDELATKSDELRRKNEMQQRALPTSSELPAFFEMLGRKVGEAGVDVKKWSYKKDTALGAYVQVPIDIELSGTYMQLKRFFSSIDPRSQARAGAGSEDRIITIEGFTLKDPHVENAEVILTASFTASTFRQDAPVAPTAAPGSKPLPVPAGAPKPSGSGSGSAGSGSGSGSAAPTNPVTKAGAAADAAMTKDQQRIDNAARAAAVQANGKMGGDL